jgi:hypothetical protein
MTLALGAGATLAAGSAIVYNQTLEPFALVGRNLPGECALVTLDQDPAERIQEKGSDFNLLVNHGDGVMIFGRGAIEEDICLQVIGRGPAHKAVLANLRVFDLSESRGVSELPGAVVEGDTLVRGDAWVVLGPRGEAPQLGWISDGPPEWREAAPEAGVAVEVKG